MKFASPQRIDRRTLLRGTGAAIALPFLDAMLPRQAWAAGASGPALGPKRTIFVYTPNGYLQDRFLPNGVGPEWELTPTLEPLANVKEQVTLVTGLDRTFVPGTGVHAQCGACWLTSSPPDRTRDGGFPTDLTLDQLIAKRTGDAAPFPSLELSCNDFADNKETKYFESISWYGPGHAAETEKDPRAVFERLFASPDGDRSVRSVLDVVLADADRLRKRLGQDDQAKLDEYLDSVRAVERRIEAAERLSSQERVELARPGGIPLHRGDYIRLMCDLAVLAFRQDRTRVVTLVIDPERWDSPRSYHGVFDSPQNHHVLTHTKSDEAKEKLARIDRFHVEQFAYLVERMAQTPDGGGTLLDSGAAIMGSGISDGDKHNYRDLQVLIAGSLGRSWSPGRRLHYDGERPLADLWLTIARQAGADVEEFADSSAPLAELSS